MAGDENSDKIRKLEKVRIKSHEKSEKKFQEVSRSTFGLQNCFALKD